MSNNDDEDWSTVATCSKCGKPLTECVCSSAEKKADRKILIEHQYSNPKAVADELKRLKDENENYKSVIALEAEKSFKSEKEAILEQIPEDRRDEIEQLIGENPDVLEQVRTQIALNPPVIRQTGRRAPKGKAGLPNSQSNAEFVSGVNEYHALIDELYKTARLSANPVERTEANDKIDELFGEYEKGMFEHKSVDFHTVTSQCLRCGSILNGVDAERYVAGKGCAVCGYKSGIVRKPKHLERY